MARVGAVQRGVREIIGCPFASPGAYIQYVGWYSSYLSSDGPFQHLFLGLLSFESSYSP